MNYSDSEKEDLLGYPILSLLSVFGKRTDRKGPLHFSPFRDEKVGSFKIDFTRNVWYDHGEGRGGNVFSLAQRLLGLPDSRKSEVWDYLASLSPQVIPLQACSRERRTPSGSRIIIDNISDSLPGFIYSYAASRGIGRSTLGRCCKAVRYHIEGSGKTIIAIGFPCGDDGWVLRRATDTKGAPFQKRCTSSHFTAIGPGGERIHSPAHGCVTVLEGFFDYLSWLELRGTDAPESDVCVLNSVSNTERALGFITGHSLVITVLDNDRAGRESTEKIRRAVLEAGGEFRDDSPRMGACNDLNDYLRSLRHLTSRTERHP